MGLRIFNNAEALADAAADEIESWLRFVGGQRAVGLAGGSTPRRTYAHLSRRPIGWGDVHGWLTDERHVPVTHEDSNAGMVRRTLFDHVPATLHEVPWHQDAEAAATAYEEELQELLDRGTNGKPQPGLIILGVGEDGHTASLFPGSSALEEEDRDYIATRVEDGWRLTATIGLLTRARRTIFLVSGRRKAEVVAEIVEGNTDLPAARVAGGSRDTVWLLDAEAASLLSEDS